MEVDNNYLNITENSTITRCLSEEEASESVVIINIMHSEAMTIIAIELWIIAIILLVHSICLYVKASKTRNNEKNDIEDANENIKNFKKISIMRILIIVAWITIIIFALLSRSLLLLMGIIAYFALMISFAIVNKKALKKSARIRLFLAILAFILSICFFKIFR